jgi:hypothetical protein
MNHLSKLPNVGATIFATMSKLAQQHGAINLSQGFPNFSTSNLLKEAAQKAIEENHNQYAPLQGIPKLVDAIIQKTNMRSMMKSKKVSTVVNNEDHLTEEQKAWWNELKNLKIDVFGFTGQELGKFAKPLGLESDSLHLVVKFPAVSPALETSLLTFKEKDPVSKIEYPKYSMRTEDKYAVVYLTKGVISKDHNGKFFFQQQN